MQKTLTPTKAFSEIKKVAEQIRNDELQAVGTVSAGDVIRQGDLYLVALGKAAITRGELLKDRQLAPGTTQGSRHCIEGDVDLFRASNASQVAETINRLVKNAAVEPELIGPVFVTDGKCELTHPEHGKFALPAGETFAVVYQRAHADVVRRQMD